MSHKNDPEVSSNDYIELFLRHLVRDPKVFNKAKDFKLVGDDFRLNAEYGLEVYKGIVDSVMEINTCPIDPALLGMHLAKRFDNGGLSSALYEPTAELLWFMYKDTLNSAYFLSTLKAFLLNRRGEKVLFNHSANIVETSGKLSEIGTELDMADSMDGAESLYPFASPVFSATHHAIPTGFEKLDTILNGLAPGEYGQVIGFSGGGKTAMGCNFAFNLAHLARNATFVSLEGSGQEIANRFYANLFQIPYTELHKGGSMLITQAFRDAEHDPHLATMRKHLKIEGLKGMTPVNVDQLHAKLVQSFETDGFIPELVIIDQLQFIEPRAPLKSDNEWQREKKAAVEIDELSHKTIGGKPLAVWLLHQAKGKLKRIFSRDDINGFKGIIHSADVVIGIGRDNEQSNDFAVFSLKTRHCPSFIINYIGDLQYMRFAEAAREGSLAAAGYSTNEQSNERRTRRENPALASVEP